MAKKKGSNKNRNRKGAGGRQAPRRASRQGGRKRRGARDQRSLTDALPPAPTEIRITAAVLLAIALFMVTGLGCGDSIKGCAMAATVTAVLVGVLRFRRLKERMTLPFAALFLMVLMGGISTQYAVSGKFALGEFLQMLIGLDAAVILTALAPGRSSSGSGPRNEWAGASATTRTGHADGSEDPAGAGLWMASVLEGAGLLLALVNIDLVSTRWISGLFLGLLHPFTSFYENAAGMEPGIRLISMFGSPNAFAALMAVLILLSLGLVSSTLPGRPAEEHAGASRKPDRVRLFHIVCLFAESLTFVLAFSLGASAILAAAFLLYLLLESRERRGAQLILMLETLMVTAAAAVLAAPVALKPWDGPRLLPILCLLGGSAALVLSDYFIGSRLSAKLEGRYKITMGILAGILCLIVLFVPLAGHWTGSMSLQAGETLERTIYPAAGSCSLKVESDHPVKTDIVSQNEAEIIMHTETLLYSGQGDGASFTVPDGSQAVRIRFTADQDTTLTSVEYESTDGAGSVPLRYRLLPGYAANRIQGLRHNENAVQRLVFFRDGMKLFARRPLIGLGLGGFENGIKSVQSFYYETKYAHNHYIQTMVDTGLIGLALFLFLLFVSAAAVFRERRAESFCHPLVPALGAVLFMMAAHAAVDVDFSHFCFIPAAYCVFALTGVCCRASYTGERVASVRKAAVCLLLTFLLLWIGLLGMNLRAAGIVKRDASFENLSKAAAMDRFEWADYLVSYIYYASAGEQTDEAVLEKAERYAERLKKLDSNSIPLYLAEYYFRMGDQEEGFAMIQKYLDYCSSDPKAWGKAFMVLMKYDDGSEQFAGSVRTLEEKMEKWQSENLGTIELEEDVRNYLARYV